MEKGVHELRREYWRRIILECNSRDSGVTKRSWCREHNISQKSFYYWQKQFRTEAVDTFDPPLSNTSSIEAPTTIPDFVEITDCLTMNNDKVKTEAVVLQTDSSSIPELMIKVDDYQIFVHSTIQEKTLETVMRVLRHA